MKFAGKLVLGIVLPISLLAIAAAAVFAYLFFKYKRRYAVSFTNALLIRICICIYHGDQLGSDSVCILVLAYAACFGGQLRQEFHGILFSWYLAQATGCLGLTSEL